MHLRDRQQSEILFTQAVSNEMECPLRYESSYGRRLKITPRSFAIAPPRRFGKAVFGDVPHPFRERVPHNTALR